MYQEKKYKIKSHQDGLELDVMEVVPEGTIKGLVQFSHGMVEHKERYLDFMIFLAEHGYASIIHDHRGHGKSVRSQEDWGYFYDRSGDFIVEDLNVVQDALRIRWPHLPLTLFGHSMGSLVVRKYIKKYDDRIDKLIVCGAPGNNPMTGVAVGLVDVLSLIKSDRYRSAFISSLATGSYDKKFEGDKKNRWLSENQDNVDVYNSTPECTYTFTLNGFRNLFSLVRDTYDPKGWQLKNRELPILFIAGRDDPVILSEEKWQQAQQFLRNLGYRHIQGRLYDHMRHEILQETEHSRVYEDVLAFLETPVRDLV